MMNAQLSPKQWQKLTDYLDGTLSAQDQTAIERLIASTPGLQEELESIQQTRKLLRNLPTRRLPRNFTLTPEMVSKRTSSFYKFFPILSFTSGVSALLLVLLFAFQTLLSSPQTAQPAAMESAPALALQNDSAAASQESAQQPDIILWGGPLAYGMGGGGGQVDGRGGGPAASSSETMPMEKSRPAESPSTEMLPPESPQPEIMESQPPSLMAEPMPTEGLPAAPQPAMPAATMMPNEGFGPILGIPPKDQEGRILPTPETSIEGLADVPEQPVRENQPSIPYIQVGLAVIALLTGLGALFVRWKSHNV